MKCLSGLTLNVLGSLMMITSSVSAEAPVIGNDSDGKRRWKPFGKFNRNAPISRPPFREMLFIL